jgi:glutathione S-transferase
MPLTLYSHPFSSYCQKVLVALYENDVAFEYQTLEDPTAMAELKARWPFARFPILVDDGRTVVESTIIIEHLMLEHGGRVRWLPEDPRAALEVRFLDRFFDNEPARTKRWWKRGARSMLPMPGWSTGSRDAPGPPAST